MDQTIEWLGYSFRKYKHTVSTWPGKFEKGPGNFIFCSIDADYTWSPIYIGETNDLSEPFVNHRKMRCIMGLGATHVHAHANSGGEAARLDERNELIQIYDPICQHF